MKAPVISVLFLLGLLLPSYAQEKVGRPVDIAIDKGVNFLVKTQNKDGSWGGPTGTKGLNIYAPVPGAHRAFRLASSSLALSGLIDAKSSSPEAQAAILKGEAYLVEKLPLLRRADPTTTYNVWAHSYGLRALADLAELAKGDKARFAKLKEVAATQLYLLERYADIKGGWGYLDLDDIITQKPSGIPTSFTTGTALLAVADCQKAFGIGLKESTVKKAVALINLQRTPDLAYTYSISHRNVPRRDINRPAGSLGRSHTCNSALRIYGDNSITDKDLQKSLKRFIARHGFLSNGRKRPIPHEAPFKIAGYFFYYGHFYVSETISLLPPEETKESRKALVDLLLPLQEKDGSWWDYPLYDYHKPYGTGYTLIVLSRYRDMGL